MLPRLAVGEHDQKRAPDTGRVQGEEHNIAAVPDTQATEFYPEKFARALRPFDVAQGRSRAWSLLISSTSRKNEEREVTW